jgi:hypothetical protein
VSAEDHAAEASPRGLVSVGLGFRARARQGLARAAEELR